MRKVTVELGTRSYPVWVGPQLLESLGPRCLAQGWSGRCAVIADAAVARHYGERTLRSLTSSGFRPTLLTLPPGEPSKRLRRFEILCEQLADQRIERRSFIVALGGGVTGDLAGFIAATFLRGIPFVQCPTTLLAQVDSSVGGKVGVNLKAGKNLVGAFLQPRFVLCDLDTLKTLPDRELRAGLAEVIKYGIIRDATLFRRLERDLDALLARDPRVLEPVIARCCAIKADVVAADETESGERAILNFGHTLGHALEAITAYGHYLHGEAISLGQVAAAHLSSRLVGLPARDTHRIQHLFERAGLPVTLHLSPTRRRRLLDTTRLDKKARNGEVRFVLVPKLGQAVWDQSVPAQAVNQALDALQPV
jgi:3-dehydroquinate synthase